MERSLVPDLVEFLLEREIVEAGKRQAQKQADSAIEQEESFAKGALISLCSLNGGGIGNAPMRGHRLAGPHRADFLRRVVADREDEIELGRPGLSKLLPALAAQAVRGEMSAIPFA